VQSPSEPIISGLAEHDVSSNLALAILELFGTVKDGVWDVDIHRTVGEVGKGLLVDLGGRSEGSEVFMERWKETVGETWAEYCDLKLLEVCLYPPNPSLPYQSVSTLHMPSLSCLMPLLIRRHEKRELTR
jgi:hypothetical protein